MVAWWAAGAARPVVIGSLLRRVDADDAREDGPVRASAAPPQFDAVLTLMSLAGAARDDVRVRVARPVALASACLGLTVLAEVGAVVLAWGLGSAYDAIFF